MLDIDSVSRSFGGVFALREVSLSVAEGEVRAVIGPNGAGKSTLFNLISGHLVSEHGSITYQGRRIDGDSAHQRAHQGVAIVFQGARIFRGMTVLENVMVGAHASTRHGFVASALRLPRQLREERVIRDRARAALERVDLTTLGPSPGGVSSSGSAAAASGRPGALRGPKVVAARRTGLGSAGW